MYIGQNVLIVLKTSSFIWNRKIHGYSFYCANCNEYLYIHFKRIFTIDNFVDKLRQNVWLSDKTYG
jgi:hypothetical protein